MPYVIAVKPDLCPEGMENCRCIGHTRRVVAALDEHIVFNAREWEAAGYDQPDGNLQFFHHALILSRKPSRERRRPQDETAEVLWLHDGKITSGHFIDSMRTPGGPTGVDRERYPNWPERWDGRLVPGSGGTVGPLPNGTVIEVELV